MRKVLPLILVLIVVSSLYNFSDDSKAAEEWSKLPPMPTERTEVTASTVGSSIYVIGGFDKDGNTADKVELFDARTGTWSQAKELPVPLHHAASASHEGKLYVVGGYRAGWIPSNTLFIYDPFTNQWDEGSNMPTPRGALTAQFIDGILYAVGGWSGLPLSVNEAYDPSTDSWTEKEVMPTAREHLASGFVDDKLYVIGGRQGSLGSNLDTNEEYDPKTDKWTTKAPMPSKRGGIVGASLSDSVYVFGGESSAGTFDNSEQYIAPLDKWVIRSKMPTARHGLAAAEAGGSIYIIGGGLKPGLSVSGKNEAFTPVDWKKTFMVQVEPHVSIEPKTATTDDKMKVTISFQTNTAGYFVQFGKIDRMDKAFAVDIIVMPPLPDMVVAQVITTHSQTYTLEKLPVGEYRFDVSINGQKSFEKRFVIIAVPLLIDASEDRIIEASKGRQVVIERGITNSEDVTQLFIYILQVKNSDSVTVVLSWIEGELPPKKSVRMSQTWIPNVSDQHLVELFVWESMENPKILAPMRTVTINVV
ncbi:MAG: Kelch repeat-containing protein [Nitrososphaerales archaeon]